LTDREFERLVASQAGKLFRIAWGILGQESDAWDALQEATLAAYKSRHQILGGSAAFPAWFRRILITRCLNELRSRRKVVPVDPETLPEPEPLPSLEHHLDGLAVWEAIESLEHDQRQVLMLRYLADLSTEQVAEALQIPTGTVKSRLNRALNKLRAVVDQEGREIR
jgi:RNA polymerase sigma-70 factor (ECF subfamily)